MFYIVFRHKHQAFINVFFQFVVLSTKRAKLPMSSMSAAAVSTGQPTQRPKAAVIGRGCTRNMSSLLLQETCRCRRHVSPRLWLRCPQPGRDMLPRETIGPTGVWLGCCHLGDMLHQKTYVSLAYDLDVVSRLETCRWGWHVPSPGLWPKCLHCEIFFSTLPKIPVLLVTDFKQWLHTTG